MGCFMCTLLYLYIVVDWYYVFVNEVDHVVLMVIVCVLCDYRCYKVVITMTRWGGEGAVWLYTIQREGFT